MTTKDNDGAAAKGAEQTMTDSKTNTYNPVDERTAEEIADEHDHIVEFGRAMKAMQDTLQYMEAGGSATMPGVWEAFEVARDNLETATDEELDQREFERADEEVSDR